MKTIGNKSKLFAELIAIGKKNEMRDDEFTAEEFAKSLEADGTKIKRRAVLDRLYQLCNDGVLQRRMITIDGRRTNAFSKVRKS